MPNCQATFQVGSEVASETHVVVGLGVLLVSKCTAVPWSEVVGPH